MLDFMVSMYLSDFVNMFFNKCLLSQGLLLFRLMVWELIGVLSYFMIIVGRILLMLDFLIVSCGFVLWLSGIFLWILSVLEFMVVLWEGKM